MCFLKLDCNRMLVSCANLRSFSGFIQVLVVLVGGDTHLCVVFPKGRVNILSWVVLLLLLE